MNRIREIRKAQRPKLSLEKLAERTGITIPHLSRLERGERPLTGEWIEKISMALNVSPRDLLHEPASGAVGVPKPGRFVDDPDQLAILEFFDGLDRDGRVRAFRVLTAALGKSEVA